jgi:glycerate dehydrogenase
MTWGIVGGGAIGTRVAELASAFGAHILMHRRTPDDRYEQVDMDELCRRSDIISLHVPLNDGTHHLINRTRIALIKPDAILINMARGAVTDEEALADAVEQGKIGGLGVDVYSREPFGEDHPFQRLLHYDNVCLTPHMAWGSAQARARCVAIIAENITHFFEGSSQNRIV